MPIVTDTIVSPALVPIPTARVEIRLFIGSTDGAAFLASQEIFPLTVVRPDAAGLISVMLPANSTLTPANSYYQAAFVIQGQTTRYHTFIVPNTAGPFLLHDILAVAPADGPTPAAYLSSALPLALAATADPGDNLFASHDDHVHPWTGLATDAEVTAAVAAHAALGDPHPGYLTPAEGTAAYDALGAATSAVATHAGLADPHPTYLTSAEGNAAYDALGAATAAVAAHTDTDVSAAAIHHTLGTGAFQSAAGNHAHAGVYDPVGTAAAAVATHEADTTAVHGIADTADLARKSIANTWSLAQTFSAQSIHTLGLQLGADVFLTRDAANVLALRNGTNPQALLVYNTYTDASNYERTLPTWGTNRMQVGPEKLGSGTLRALDIAGFSISIYPSGVTSQTGRWNIASGGTITPGSDNVADFGDATHRARDVYSSRQLLAADGTNTAPGIAFGAQPGTGFYRFADSHVRLACNGVFRYSFNAGDLSLPTGILQAANGIQFGTSAYDVGFTRTAVGSLDIGSGAQASNGQALGIKRLTELTTIAAAATTDTAIQLPANAIILAVSVRVTVAIPTATNFTVGDAGSAARFSTAAVSVAATSTDPGTKAGAYFNATAAAVRITPDLTPGANTGRVRVTIHYIDVTPATS